MFKNVPSCANDWLLQTTLRDSWRFEGYVTSDCGAVNNECQAEPKGHGLYNCTEAAALSIKAGTDVDCSIHWYEFSKEIINAVAGGLLDEALVDQSFARLSTIQMELGLFDNNKAQQPYFNLGIDHIDTAAHKQLALEAAQQAIVLLKNDGVLPLRPGKKIAGIYDTSNDATPRHPCHPHHPPGPCHLHHPRHPHRPCPGINITMVDIITTD